MFFVFVLFIFINDDPVIYDLSGVPFEKGIRFITKTRLYGKFIRVPIG
jgi:hypothetical protein